MSPEERGSKVFVRAHPRLIAGLVFAASLTCGLAATIWIRDEALKHLPQREVYEALYRDGLAVQYSCGGLLLSLTISTALTMLAAKFARGT